ncbi:MAG: chemotaxis protein CheW [Paenibacillaceae bacterium]|uniref:Chemotaxis protein CheW n=1 Tax=Paenibacillus mellifer TaxID=2937794 RepID=A0A9X1Y3J3_9BACL|nr:chemotaxis protein CheW [Paenibacillus mellifer]MBW4841228.1 chemotaxis protein CheW [Paenibacillaceae bacterium]MCK8488996.1 chemotaxis protein CheW [Paenibacillus mellifer]
MADPWNGEEAELFSDSLRDKYLTFLVEREQYGIEIKYVTEIIGIQPITAVPQMPEYIRGIINLRGTVIPVMDVRIRFGMPPRSYSDRTCVIVVELEDMPIGLIVDSVAEVMSIPAGDIVPPPELRDGENRFVAGVGKSGGAMLLLLDCNRFINERHITADTF